MPALKKERQLNSISNLESGLANRSLRILKTDIISEAILNLF